MNGKQHHQRMNILKPQIKRFSIGSYEFQLDTMIAFQLFHIPLPLKVDREENIIEFRILKIKVISQKFI